MKRNKRLLWGYIDHSGEIVIAPQFDGAENFHEERAVVKIDWRRGYIDLTGAPVIEPQFQFADSFSDGLGRVMLDDRWGYIDRDGHIAIDLKYDAAENFHDGIAQVRLGDNEMYIDRQGRPTTTPATETPETEEVDALTPSLDGDKFGYVNASGEFVIKPSFVEAEPFCEGVARVKTGAKTKWGFIDMTGKPAFKEKFIQAGDFSDGLARVLVEIFDEA